MAVQDAKDLTVFKKAYELAMRIFNLSRSFPAEERYALTSQNTREVPDLHLTPDSCLLPPGFL